MQQQNDSKRSIKRSMGFQKVDMQGMFLNSIELLNFKSFEGHHMVGPFLTFTGIVGPNGGGKSNIFDAISFALILKQLSKKHKHVSELIYREEHESFKNNHREMSVQLNFKNEKGEKVVVKRAVNSQGVCEYYVNDQQYIAEEYVQALRELKLQQIQNFCAYQGKLEDLCFKEGNALVNVFEEISGSQIYKQPCEEIQAKIGQCDDQIKADTENLHSLRLEKVKMKGLQEYVDHMKDCLSQQKKTETQIHLAEILLADRTISSFQKQLVEYEKGLDDTLQAKQAIVKDMKSHEIELKRLQNQEEQLRLQTKQKKDDTLNMQFNSMNKQKAIDSCKAMIQQKKGLLQKMQAEKEVQNTKQKEYQQKLEQSKQELEKLQQEIETSSDLKAKEAQRQEYLQIRSNLESDNAQIGRQLTLIEQKLNYLNEKKRNLQLQMQSIKGQLAKETEYDQLKQQKDSLTKEITQTEKTLKSLKDTYQKSKQNQMAQKEEVSKLERALLEKEFELKEIENEKQIRSQDAKLNQTLEELKKRCKGYLGQVYEVIKPINNQYDIAVKVALSKCLKFLVVENQEAAEYCTDFLKDKQLYKEVLVLSNVPDRQIDMSVNRKLQGSGHLVYDVIEVSRRHNNLDKAIRYFLGEKVVCKDFETAIKIQKSGVKDIVTEDGTEFKSGMISGGQHQNIFNVNFGSFKLDKEINKLADDISKLEKKLSVAREAEKSDKINELQREITKTETQLDNLKQRNNDTEKLIKQAKEKAADLVSIYESLESSLKELDKQINEAKETKQELQRDFSEVEKEAFKKFLQKYKLKSLEEYEAQRSTEVSKKIYDKKNELIQTISKCESELAYMEKSNNERSIQAVETILQQEEDKLKSLLSETESIQYVNKMQQEIQEQEAEIMKIQKQKDEILKKQQSLRAENEKLQNRIESLQKDINLLRVQVQNWEAKKQAKFEEGQLKLIILQNNDDYDMNENMIQTESKNQVFDIKKVDMSVLELDDPFNSSTSQITELLTSLHDTLRQLQNQEEEFNQNAALVPESDPNVNKINDRILQIKEEVEKLNQERQQFQQQLKEVSHKRNELFLQFFDQVAQIVQQVYQKLTQKDSNLNQGGQAQLFIDDRVSPFDKNIHYYPCPPGKRSLYDVSQLSGGEKTVAALALLFSIIQVKAPPFLLLDEVDAFLDAQNVNLVTDFIKNELKTQTIMISHKENVVQNALSLIGASFVKQHKTSKIYSLDLRNYSE